LVTSRCGNVAHLFVDARESCDGACRVVASRLADFLLGSTTWFHHALQYRRRVTMEAKKWTTPQLVVLGRGTADEAVLAACKATGTSGPGLTGACKANPSCANNATS
jgi:hypothetical protein